MKDKDEIPEEEMREFNERMDRAEAEPETFTGNENILLPKELKGGDDSLDWLESFGFTVTTEGATKACYWVNPPRGWVAQTEGHWTSFRDQAGKLRFRSYIKDHDSPGEAYIEYA
jgi:hypothetical protein